MELVPGAERSGVDIILIEVDGKWVTISPPRNQQLTEGPQSGGNWRWS